MLRKTKKVKRKTKVTYLLLLSNKKCDFSEFRKIFTKIKYQIKNVVNPK